MDDFRTTLILFWQLRWRTRADARAAWFMVLGCLWLSCCCALDPKDNDTASCPSVCFCDDVGSYVSCVGDGLLQLPGDLPATAERLELRNFVLTSLDGRCFESLTELRELKLQQSRLSEVKAGTLSHLSKLNRLDMCQNALVNLSSGVFEGLSNLRYLDLSSNHLTDIDEAFQGLANVEQLNLRANRLPRLTGRTLRGLQRVQYLNMDLNAVSHIDVDAFQHLSNLAHLILSNNPLRTLSRLDFFGARLQYVDVSNVGLERVPQSLTRFVRDLRLARNNITRIVASDFESYPYLGLLVLDDNDISEMENDALGRQEYLLRLWLNGNKMTRVPTNLPASLLALYMEENLLEEIGSNNFRGLVNLEQLFLQRNRIAGLAPCAFCQLSKLKSLDLQSNQIEHLADGVFANLSLLEVLDLSQNNLRMLDSRCMAGLDGLKTLQLSRVNQPVAFPESVFDSLQNLQLLEMYDSPHFVQKMVSSTRVLHSLRRLQELNIMHNKLTGLRSDFPSFFPQLKVIKLSGNSWYCGPDISWLAGWIKNSNIQFYMSYDIRCASPERLHQKPVMMLSQDETWISTPALPSTGETFLSSSVGSEVTDSQRSARNITDPPQVLSTSLPAVGRRFDDHIGNSVVGTATSRFDSSTFPSATDSTSTTVPPWTGRKPTPTPTSNRSASQVQRFYLTPSTQPPPSRSPQYRFGEFGTLTVSCALAGSGTAVVMGAVVLVAVRRFRRRHGRLLSSDECKSAGIRRSSSSISYHPQRDEVSIVTVSEGTVGWKTATHTGLGNRLYYALEDVDIMGEGFRSGGSPLPH